MNLRIFKVRIGFAPFHQALRDFLTGGTTSLKTSTGVKNI